MAEEPGPVRKTRMWQAKVVRMKDDKYNTDNILEEITQEHEEKERRVNSLTFQGLIQPFKER